MNTNKGIFLVIEGSDDSRDSTQFTKLVERLKTEGHDVVGFDFPQYQEPSSYFIRENERGTFGEGDEVGPYTGSVFYALDRYAAVPKIKEALNAGKIVVANHFTGSSMAHYGASFTTAEDRKNYFLWLEAIEFTMLNVPHPDLSVILHAPTAYNSKIITAFDSVLQLFPKRFKQLDCVRNNTVLTDDAIHNLVWETFHPLLPAEAPKPVKTAISYTIPDTLDDDTLASFTRIMDAIIQTHTVMIESASTLHGDEKSQLLTAIDAVLPVATDTTYLPKTLSTHMQQLANAELSSRHSDDNTSVTLVAATPRNELDIVPSLLYEFSGSSLRQIQSEVSDWTYVKKASVLETYKHGQALRALSYTFDILTSYDEAKKLTIGSTVQQSLTPRYGYEVPQVIIDHGLSDQFEACFDASLKLYSILQSAGREHEAQYATLRGHRVRLCLTVCGNEITADTIASLPSAVTDTMAEVHPITINALRN